MPRTSVLSIRIDSETRKILEECAEKLEMKVTTLAARVLKECTLEWTKNYVRQLYADIIEAEEKKDD